MHEVENRRSTRYDRSVVVSRLQLVVKFSGREDVDERACDERACGAWLPRDKDAGLCHPAPSPRRSPGTSRSYASSIRSRTPTPPFSTDTRLLVYPLPARVRDGIKYLALVANSMQLFQKTFVMVHERRHKSCLKDFIRSRNKISKRRKDNKNRAR
ncbi:hypothetical protein PUN28_004900 [Cardiocondyla obscurior]|uniref:Uncharacterized protein n=1 Tax=Cardiocondyla obscurior TaxID=286306 RepID=A0AAW2GFQ5_9HYME